VMTRARSRSWRSAAGLTCGTLMTAEEATLATAKECSNRECDSQRQGSVQGPPPSCAPPSLLDQCLGIRPRSRSRRGSGDRRTWGCCDRHQVKLVLVAP
jgi:hypothetical protein